MAGFRITLSFNILSSYVLTNRLTRLIKSDFENFAMLDNASRARKSTK